VSTPLLANGLHTFRVRTVDPRGNIEPTPATRTFTVNSPPSGMAITGGPAEGATTTDRTPTFTFSAETDPATFVCKVDPGGTFGPAPFAPCSGATAHTPATLADGTWTLWVQAYDDTDTLIGETSRTFNVDATAPQTTLLTGPPALSSTTSGSFTFSASEPNAEFECRLDSTDTFAWTPCSSPRAFSGLANGTHTFEVRAVDAYGNRDSTPAATTFTVDTQAPAVSITSAPAALTNDRTPDFGFSTEAGAGVECSIDRGTPAFGACTAAHGHTPAAPLADGNWTFRVRATDGAGNDATVTRGFRVDATPPQTRIARKPAKALKTRRRKRPVTFVFAASESASYLCAIDSKPLRACPRKVTRRLGPGNHRMRVVAIDAAGNRDTTPATYRFTIKRAG
jgi:hypothetical protein